ncbi:hypothetical protein [uncultured Agrobacterium sp.]|uniref:hypothetical protein n=1 Tax=uncultured Agrobacterium sp. TaxID=157277 RepID=UPI0025EBEF67|nr:hypothetical protein [uncultured Agrobacterium sp.]
MRDIDDLLPEVLIHAPNCADPVAVRYLREAARQMCEKVDIWRERNSIIISNDEESGLVAVPDAEIVRIETASLDGVPLTPQSPEWLDENYPGWDDEVATGATSRFVTQIKPGVLQVVPFNVGTLKVRLILKPSRDALTFPDFLVEKYGTELGKGAAARVLMLPTDDTGSNPQMGTLLQSEFSAFLDTLPMKVAKGQQGARVRTRGSYF